MSSVAGEGVGVLLVHKVCYRRLKFGFGTLPLAAARALWGAEGFLFARWFCVQPRKLSGCMRRQSQQQFDQCDQRGRGTWARPILSRRTRRLSEQVRHRARHENNQWVFYSRPRHPRLIFVLLDAPAHTRLVARTKVPAHRRGPDCTRGIRYVRLQRRASLPPTGR
jgi:hypothetical protein